MNHLCHGLDFIGIKENVPKVGVPRPFQPRKNLTCTATRPSGRQCGAGVGTVYAYYFR